MTATYLAGSMTHGSLAPSASPCASSDLRALERTRFFPRQIVTPDDLTQDQIYFREKAKRHNRMLHGWGVVCGACVSTRGGTGCEVIVEPGYVLGPFGDEIVIDKEVVLDVCRMGAGERDGCCGDELDPWCGDAKSDCVAGTMYLAVRYSECMARPVHGGSCGCGCDDSECEYSRTRDGYTFKLLRDLPAGYTTPMQPAPPTALDPCRGGKARACPPCPADPWVILADILVGADCKVRNVNCFTHRRYVMSFASFYQVCSQGAGATVGTGMFVPGQLSTQAAGLGQARMMAMMTGSSQLMDTSALRPTDVPRASVSVLRADGSTTSLPAFFTVERGSTVADLLEREGEREFYDPVTDQSLTLRQIYLAAGVSPTARLEGTASALAMLEGRTLGSAPASAPREAPSRPAPTDAQHPLHDVLDPSAIALLDEHTDVGALPATSIAGISESSALGQRLAELTIADVGAMKRADFLAHALEGAPTRRRKQIESQAREVWDRARRATSAYADEGDG